MDKFGEEGKVCVEELVNQIQDLFDNMDSIAMGRFLNSHTGDSGLNYEDLIEDATKWFDDNKAELFTLALQEALKLDWKE